MNDDRGSGFVRGLLLGGIVGAAAALLLAPASGTRLREQIRAESMAVKQRGQEIGGDAVRQAEKVMQQGRTSVAGGRDRTMVALEEQRKNLLAAIDAGKRAAAERQGQGVK